MEVKGWVDIATFPVRSLFRSERTVRTVLPRNHSTLCDLDREKRFGRAARSPSQHGPCTKGGYRRRHPRIQTSLVWTCALVCDSPQGAMPSANPYRRLAVGGYGSRPRTCSWFPAQWLLPARMRRPRCMLWRKTNRNSDRSPRYVRPMKLLPQLRSCFQYRLDESATGVLRYYLDDTALSEPTLPLGHDLGIQ